MPPLRLRAERPSKVSEILDRLDDAAEHDAKVTIGAALKALGSRSYGLFLIAPALLVLTPIGAIPAVLPAIQPSSLARSSESAGIVRVATLEVVGDRLFWVIEIAYQRRKSE